MHGWLSSQFEFLVFAGVCTAAFAGQYFCSRRKDEGTPWLVWLLSVVLLLCTWCLADDAEQRERRNIQSITEGFVRLYGDEMEKSGHWKLPSDVAGDDPLYLSLIETEIRWLSLNHVVNDIYTMRKRADGKNILVVDSETDYNHNGKYDEEREQRTKVGEVYEEADAGLERAFQGTPNFQFQPVTDRWGTWVSAFVPLLDPEGRVEGVLGVDFNAYEFASKIADAKLRVIGLMALVEAMLFGSSTLNMVLRRQITERKRTEEQLRVQTTALDAAANAIVITDRKGTIQSVNHAFTTLTGYTPQEAVGQNPRVLKSGSHDEAFYRNMWQTVSSGQVWSRELINRRKDGSLYPEEMTITPVRNADGVIVRYIAIKQDITERKQIEEALQRQKAELQVLFDLIPAMVWFKDTKNGILRANKRVAEALGKSVEEIEGKPSLESYYADDLEVIRSGAPKLGIVEKARGRDGKELLIQTDKVPYCDKDGKVIGIVVMSQDVTERKKAEKELDMLNKQLLETSRQAGMAEVANSVLHNVGNVLNSVNVSATLVTDGIRKSKGAYLGKVVRLLDEHTADLGGFMTSDPKGRQLPGYLRQLSEHLIQEQENAVTELESLRKNIEHIKEIVAMQQSYSKVSGVTETVKVTDLVEDSLRMNDGALARHEVEVVREYQASPLITVEKHKVLQLLVNLIRNAKYACDDARRKDKQMTIRVANGEGRIKISVADNGVGIPPENLTRIFSHGFTTRKNGHGFGLHSGALAAREMGGTLTAHSDGPGCGARFTLELPAQ